MRKDERNKELKARNRKQKAHYRITENKTEKAKP